MTIQSPGFQGTTQETPRVLTRGQLQFFIFSFFYDQAQTIPVQPIDSQTYPNFRILDPSSNILAQGVALVGSGPGIWRVGWVVPKDAPLTNVQQRYRLQVVMVDASLRQFETSFEFDVVEAAVPAQSPMLQQFLTFVGQPLRISFTNTVRPDYLRVVVIPRGADSSPLHVANFTFPVPAVPSANDLREITKDNTFVYYTDVPSFPAVGSYSALWTVRDFPNSEQDIEHQAIQVINSTLMHQIKSLRMLIDKLQKKLGLVYAYTNEDMLEYINQGAALVNSYWPPTNFTPLNMPAALEAFTVLAGAWWGLTGQRILYSETNLDFSGQTVTLGYNPGAELDSIIGSLKETLDSQLKGAKRNIVRSASNVAFISTRPQNYRSGFLFKVGGFNGGSTTNNILQTLIAYGLPID